MLIIITMQLHHFCYTGMESLLCDNRDTRVVQLQLTVTYYDYCINLLHEAHFYVEELNSVILQLEITVNYYSKYSVCLLCLLFVAALFRDIKFTIIKERLIKKSDNTSIIPN